jgi:hypothetical protein
MRLLAFWLAHLLLCLYIEHTTTSVKREEHNPETQFRSNVGFSISSIRAHGEGRGQVPPKPLPFVILAQGGRQLGFWEASTRLPNPPPLFVFLKLVRADFFFPVERSSSSSTSWKLVKDQDHRSAWEGTIRSSSCCVSSSCSSCCSSVFVLLRLLSWLCFICSTMYFLFLSYICFWYKIYVMSACFAG